MPNASSPFPPFTNEPVLELRRAPVRESLTAALADHVEALQWQVPTTPAGAVAFDYCINNITPILQ